jgi:hypothetical protein
MTPGRVTSRRLGFQLLAKQQQPVVKTTVASVSQLAARIAEIPTPIRTAPATAAFSLKRAILGLLQYDRDQAEVLLVKHSPRLDPPSRVLFWP